MISLLITDCICIDNSGVNNIEELSFILKYTPSSVVLVMLFSETIWKPPESVKYDLSYDVKECKLS